MVAKKNCAIDFPFSWKPQWKPMDKHTVYDLWKTRNFEFTTQIQIPYWLPECKPGIFFWFTV